MHTFLVNQNKLRNRGVQLDYIPAQTLVGQPPNRDSLVTPPSPKLRNSCLTLSDQENENPSARHYRSMLVVDTPTLGPLKPLDYAGLYNSEEDFPCGIFISRRLLPSYRLV